MGVELRIGGNMVIMGVELRMWEMGFIMGVELRIGGNMIYNGSRTKDMKK